MSHPRLLLLLLLLGAVTASGRALSVSGSILGCLQAALSEPRNARPDDGALLEKRGSESPREASQEDAEEELGKRTFPGDGHRGAAPPAKGKASQSRAKGDRRAKVTLSLDVPTNIMNILFNIAKAKNLRAKAAANAHLMAQIGRRK